MTTDPTIRRSARRLHAPTLPAFLMRAALRSEGLDGDDLRRPVIGIAQTWSEFNNCNIGLRDVAAAVKRGVAQAGGVALEFPTISLGELLVSPTTMLYRNLMALDVEEMIRALPIDGVVLLGNCDKTIPALLMGAASADVPAILVSGGPAIAGRFDGKSIGACTDCRRLWTEYRAGRVSEDRLAEMESVLYRTAGACTVMGTASTMAIMAEALGMSLPGSAGIPAPDARRLHDAERAGRAIVAAAGNDMRPSHVLTRPHFLNAIGVLMACGGSTNAVIHLTAIARHAGVELTLDDFDRASREVPLLVNLKPIGEYQMEEFFEAGAVPALLHELRDLLDPDVVDIGGERLAGQLGVRSANPAVIAPRTAPLSPEGGLAVLRSSLAPNGAIIKHGAASPSLLTHTGPAVVFDSVEEMLRRIDDPALDVTPDSVLVLRNAGPLGGPGMPEEGFLPIPKKLLEQGVRDMVRVSDARMSGTAFGTIVLHASPEAAAGGPLGLVRDGDPIALDVPNRRIDLLVPATDLAARESRGRRATIDGRGGYVSLYLDHVTQAEDGCVFDVCVREVARG